MARIFITGSSDGLGLLAAQQLVKDGHRVVLHARNAQRAEQTKQKCPEAEAVLMADLSSMQETKQLAAEVNKMGKFDSVIHNAGLGYQEDSTRSVDGIPRVFAVNSLAPYILTCLINKPERLIYISSGLHTGGDASMRDLTWEKKSWSGFQAYSDSKLHNILLSNAVARQWKEVAANSLEPGWVATKMGGRGAPDSITEGYKTQAWLATAPKAAKYTGKYWYHMKQKIPTKAAQDRAIQDQFIKKCEEISGVSFPA
jgi:NAD(P)-dependent dehydrogenase (short-subunit alcohol dehydrogenase family)